MRPAHRQLALDVLWSALGVWVVVSIVVLVLDGVENARALAVDPREWLIELLARWPARANTVMPVAVALGALRVGLRWRESGEMLAAESVGIRPSSLVVVGGIASLLAAFAASAVRELAAEPASRVLAGEGGWVRVDEGSGAIWVRTDDLGVDVVHGVRTARLSGPGELVEVGRIASAHWATEWTVDGAAVAWGEGALAVTPALPSLDAWRAVAVPLGPDASVGRLFAEPAAPAAVAWLWERPATVAGAGLLGACALVLARRGSRGGWALLAVAVVFRLAQLGVVSVVARGGSAAASGVPVVAFAVLLALLVVVDDRR